MRPSRVSADPGTDAQLHLRSNVFSPALSETPTLAQATSASAGPSAEDIAEVLRYGKVNKRTVRASAAVPEELEEPNDSTVFIVDDEMAALAQRALADYNAKKMANMMKEEAGGRPAPGESGNLGNGKPKLVRLRAEGEAAPDLFASGTGAEVQGESPAVVDLKEMFTKSGLLPRGNSERSSATSAASSAPSVTPSRPSQQSSPSGGGGRGGSAIGGAPAEDYGMITAPTTGVALTTVPPQKQNDNDPAALLVMLQATQKRNRELEEKLAAALAQKKKMTLSTTAAEDLEWQLQATRLLDQHVKRALSTSTSRRAGELQEDEDAPGQWLSRLRYDETGFERERYGLAPRSAQRRRLQAARDRQYAAGGATRQELSGVGGRRQQAPARTEQRTSRGDALRAVDARPGNETESDLHADDNRIVRALIDQLVLSEEEKAQVKAALFGAFRTRLHPDYSAIQATERQRQRLAELEQLAASRNLAISRDPMLGLGVGLAMDNVNDQRGGAGAAGVVDEAALLQRASQILQERASKVNAILDEKRRRRSSRFPQVAAPSLVQMESDKIINAKLEQLKNGSDRKTAKARGQLVENEEDGGPGGGYSFRADNRPGAGGGSVDSYEDFGLPLDEHSPQDPHQQGQQGSSTDPRSLLREEMKQAKELLSSAPHNFSKEFKSTSTTGSSQSITGTTTAASIAVGAAVGAVSRGSAAMAAPGSASLSIGAAVPGSNLSMGGTAPGISSARGSRGSDSVVMADGVEVGLGGGGIGQVGGGLPPEVERVPQQAQAGLLSAAAISVKSLSKQFDSMYQAGIIENISPKNENTVKSAVFTAGVDAPEEGVEAVKARYENVAAKGASSTPRDVLGKEGPAGMNTLSVAREGASVATLRSIFAGACGGEAQTQTQARGNKGKAKAASSWQFRDGAGWTSAAQKAGSRGPSATAGNTARHGSSTTSGAAQRTLPPSGFVGAQRSQPPSARNAPGGVDDGFAATAEPLIPSILQGAGEAAAATTSTAAAINVLEARRRTGAAAPARGMNGIGPHDQHRASTGTASSGYRTTTSTISPRDDSRITVAPKLVAEVVQPPEQTRATTGTGGRRSAAVAKRRPRGTMLGGCGHSPSASPQRDINSQHAPSAAVAYSVTVVEQEDYDAPGGAAAPPPSSDFLRSNASLEEAEAPPEVVREDRAATRTSNKQNMFAKGERPRTSAARTSEMIMSSASGAAHGYRRSGQQDSTASTASYMDLRGFVPLPSMGPPRGDRDVTLAPDETETQETSTSEPRQTRPRSVRPQKSSGAQTASFGGEPGYPGVFGATVVGSAAGAAAGSTGTATSNSLYGSVATASFSASGKQVQNTALFSGGPFNSYKMPSSSADETVTVTAAASVPAPPANNEVGKSFLHAELLQSVNARSQRGGPVPASRQGAVPTKAEIQQSPLHSELLKSVSARNRMGTQELDAAVNASKRHMTLSPGAELAAVMSSKRANAQPEEVFEAVAPKKNPDVQLLSEM